MELRYEFNLKRDSCADCPLMISDDNSGYYICAPTSEVLGRYNYKEIYASERPDWCPLKIVEECEDK